MPALDEKLETDLSPSSADVKPQISNLFYLRTQILASTRPQPAQGLNCCKVNKLEGYVDF